MNNLRIDLFLTNISIDSTHCISIHYREGRDNVLDLSNMYQPKNGCVLKKPEAIYEKMLWNPFMLVLSIWYADRPESESQRARRQSIFSPWPMSKQDGEYHAKHEIDAYSSGCPFPFLDQQFLC